MKKLLLASAIALFGLSNAQIAKGTMFITGNAGYESSKHEASNNSTTVSEVKENTFSIVPTFGYFVQPNLAVGLGVGYQTSTTEDVGIMGAPTTKDTNSAFVVEPFVRKYWNVSSNFLLFGQLSIPMSFGTAKSEIQSNPAVVTEGKMNSFGIVVKPGIDFVIAPNWTIEATVGEFGYRSTTVEPKNNPTNAKSKSDNVNFGLDLGAVTFGVKYLFK